MADELVVGIDFGTLSGRVVVVRVSDGAELGTAAVAPATPTSFRKPLRLTFIGQDSTRSGGAHALPSHDPGCVRARLSTTG